MLTFAEDISIARFSHWWPYSSLTENGGHGDELAITMWLLTG